MTRWLRNALFSPPRTTRRRPQGYAPGFEVLEDRSLLSAGYLQTNLISDIPALARFTDPNLLNPWGISFNSDGPFWLANNLSGTSTVNDGEGSPTDQPLVVAVPGSAGKIIGKTTGTVAYDGRGFVVSSNGKSGPSRFLFATQDGTISGWSPRVDLDNALLTVDQSSTAGRGPIYTGLAIASTSTGAFLYAANFRTGAIDVFDEEFQPVTQPGAFTDPDLPAGFVPFNVQEIGGSLYVAYTKQEEGRYGSRPGQGNGFVDVFDVAGNFLRRAASQGPLAAPWGLAVAPSDFGAFSNSLLVGNFDDGRINAFDIHSGAFLGAVENAAGDPIELPGLWALAFGNDGEAGSSNALYFTAGIGNEQHGLFGVLQPASYAQSEDAQPSIAAALAAAPPRATSVVEDEEGYPLPPADGPALRGDSHAVDQQVALLPFQASMLAVVPTLLSGEGSGPSSFGMATAAGTEGFSSNPLTSRSDFGYLAYLLARPGASTVQDGVRRSQVPGAELVVNLSNDYESEGEGEGGDKSPDAGRLASRPGETRRPPTRIVPDGGAEIADLRRAERDAGRDTLVYSGGEDGGQELLQPAAQAREHASEKSEPTPSAGAEALAPGHVAGLAGIPLWQGILITLTAVCGLGFTRAKRILSTPSAFLMIKSMWSRSTRHSSKTVVVAAAKPSARRMARTRIVTAVQS